VKEERVIKRSAEQEAKRQLQKEMREKAKQERLKLLAADDAAEAEKDAVG
jgi:hypothetical protein